MSMTRQESDQIHLSHTKAQTILTHFSSWQNRWAAAIRLMIRFQRWCDHTKYPWLSSQTINLEKNNGIRYSSQTLNFCQSWNQKESKTTLYTTSNFPRFPIHFPDFVSFKQCVCPHTHVTLAVIIIANTFTVRLWWKHNPSTVHITQLALIIIPTLWWENRSPERASNVPITRPLSGRTRHPNSESTLLTLRYTEPVALPKCHFFSHCSAFTHTVLSVWNTILSLLLFSTFSPN